MKTARQVYGPGSFAALLLLLAVSCLSGCASIAVGDDADDPVSIRLTVIETEQFTAYVPTGMEKKLRPMVARLDQIFAFLCKESRTRPRKRPVVLLSDDDDVLFFNEDSSIPLNGMVEYE